MLHRKLVFWLFGVGGLLLVTAVFFLLLPTQSVSAQCGSQASSCKNCHETQAQKPVSNDTTTWHGQHAFGDFCYLCHGGNNQATDKTAAHTGMVDPLSDIAISCKSCHPKDYEARAQLYADTLGIKIVSLKSTLEATSNPPAAAQTAPEVAVTSAPSTAPSVPASQMVDYSQRYNEVALGKKPANVGNIIVVIMIAALVLVGGFFVMRREGWVKFSFEETKTIQGSYPADVVELVPEISKLKKNARQDLRKILSKPGTAAELFALVTKLTKGEESASPEEELPAEPPEEENPNQ